APKEPQLLADARGSEARGSVAPQRPPRETFSDTFGLAVLYKTGPVAILDPRHRVWRAIVAGEAIPYGAGIRTGPGARLEVAFGESRVRFDANTSACISQAE